MRAYTITTFS